MKNLEINQLEVINGGQNGPQSGDCDDPIFVISQITCLLGSLLGCGAALLLATTGKCFTE